MLYSTFPIALSTLTLFGRPCTTLMLGVLLIGNPVPLQVTAPVAETVQPEINWLAWLIIEGVKPLARRSAIALGMLALQSTEARAGEVQVVADPAASGTATMDGVVTL